MGDHTNFLSILEGSKAVRDRWAALVERTVTDAARHGVSIEADDVLNLRSARTAALGAPLDEDEFRAEVLALPALSDAARKTAIAAGDDIYVIDAGTCTECVGYADAPACVAVCPAECIVQG